ncbi:hypothetical protein MTR67_006850 [Solanum verrucosum]|uniref:Uncharacterized protein n=1 Tax=Solanum verrucosum TaxID=315347 RepID=A0AAF0THL3_SOLVR|nr:hypothetical protein MTR67_006850 [Solanum verrucosum]
MTNAKRALKISNPC